MSSINTLFMKNVQSSVKGGGRESVEGNEVVGVICGGGGEGEFRWVSESEGRARAGVEHGVFYISYFI